MSFETASVTTCGQSLLARATATNQLVFVNAKIETTARTAAAIGSATALPTLTNPVTGAINSVTYTLNQTRVTVRFNNLTTTADFHTVWLMVKLANELDSAAVPICAVVSSEPVYIPTTSQSDTHVDIHLNLSFVRADGTVSITEGPAFTISDHEQFRTEVREEFDDVEADIDDLQSTVVTIGGTQTIVSAKTFNATTTFNGAVQANSTLKVTGTTTLGTVSAGSTTTGALTTYAITPRTASTSSSTGYDLGWLSNQWRYVFARYGEFETSINTNGSLSVSGISNLTGDVNIGGELYVGDLTTLDEVTAGDITSTNHIPTANSTSTSTGSDLGASDTRWRYVYGRYGNFSGSISTAGTLSVTGATTLDGLTAGSMSSYSHTPRTASTSSSTGYDLGADGTRWKYVYARYGNFSYSLTVNGTVTATTFSGNLSGHLTTARDIDGMAFDGSSSITHFGTCDTAAATAAKIVSLAGFSLVTGARILVKFTNSNTASTPTLNVNSTGAVRIYLRVNTSAGNTAVTSWEAGDTVEFVYDGSYWRKVNHVTNISGNAATATSLRYSTTTVMSAAGTTTVTSEATIRPTSSGGSSLGTSSYKWNYLYCNYIGDSSYYVASAYIINMYGTTVTTTGDITVGGKLYFGTSYLVEYNNGIDCYGNLHPGSANSYNLGTSSYCWNRLYVNYISGSGVVKSLASYGTGTSQSSTYAVGSLILAKLTTTTNSSGTSLSSDTWYDGSSIGDVAGSKLTPAAFFGSDGGNTTGKTYAASTVTPTNGVWRILGKVYSSNMSSYKPTVLAVRIA